MPRALLSVSDKTGLVDFARGLTALGWGLISTGGTARTLREAGLEVTDVADVTGHPEMMDGRVKSLHPALHAGILARRDREDDLAALQQAGYDRIDLVAVNLYRFREAVAAGADTPAAMDKVDIGGPTLLRAAAKNHAGVIAVVDPADYARVLEALRAGRVASELRRALAHKVFAHTAVYDGAIAGFLGAGGGGRGEEFTELLELSFSKVQELRYGENPDQPAAFYAEPAPAAGSLPRLRQRHGKELSFNNLLDVDAAVMAISAWAGEDRAAAVVIKHTTPCGIALADSVGVAVRRAFEGDPTSAFGGIVGCNLPVDAEAAESLADRFLEIVVAPGFEPEALDRLQRKKNLRLLELPIERAEPTELDYKRVRGGLLVQRRLWMGFPEEPWRVVTAREPSDAEWRDLRFAWRASAAVKSNAIVLARDERSVGIGAGQMSRVDASRIAVMKAHDQNIDLDGAVLASDAFFPFRDGVDAAAAAGVTAIIQPGGSVRDDEVIAAADEHGMAMVFTGRRVFRH
ncbi:MAG: bifunctional phosphoribosylaminoimidazolecarboxamide formyltransferase/IMP cyclohydrolase [Longimicrobiales bacterium]